MKQKIYRFLFVCAVYAVSALLIPPATYAQDDPNTSFAKVSATRSSPFNPPTEDVFVADDGPGLDTGCTFNDDPEHPLIIDIIVDQFVGAVDANGFLVNPDPLITQGIIPASIEVIMPAFDVDFNGPAPPERDEVIFNGENLGLLNGDNQIWLLNSFTVDIRKVKFPAATGGTAANRVQINVDLLATGRWCTAIDWVALVVPIRPAIALTLTVVGGNKVREITDDVIYKQSFDADCNLTTDIGPFDEFPFSGSSNKEVTLHTEIEFCPDTGANPDVKAEWRVDGPVPLQTKGTSTWTGLGGDVKLKMLDRVAVGTANVEYEVDAQTASVARKVFVTRNDPLPTVAPPRRVWYERAVPWGQGAGPSGLDEATVLQNLLAGLYAFGNANWRYGYFGPGFTKCLNWTEMVDDPVACDFTDCFIFSTIFENMAAVLGIGGLAPVTPLGANSRGFLTDGSPSIDPAFTGNSRPFAGGAYDRYLFSSHSLRLKGSYYDATFNGIYGASDAFIAYNLTGSFATDADGDHLTTDEGAKIYLLPGDAYDSWGNSRYKTPPAAQFRLVEAGAILASTQTGLEALRVSATDIQLTGTVSFSTVDDDANGLDEAVLAAVEVEVLTAGEYSVYGELKQGGVSIARRPFFESMLLSKATVSGAPGTYTAELRFSGEEIFRSGEDGPYDLSLLAIGIADSDQLTVPTPAYTHTQFGEVGAVITGVSDVAVDDDGDGDFDAVETTVDVEVRVPGTYRLQGALSVAGGGETLATAGDVFTLGVGAHALTLRFAGQALLRSGIDGPYEFTVSLLDDLDHVISGGQFTTQAYLSGSFGALLNLDGSFFDQGFDTNGNSLFDLLRIEFGADVQTAGSYLVSGQLTGGPNGDFIAFTDMPMTLAAGPQTITLDFAGPLIREQGIDGPYDVEVVVRESTTFDELDRVPVGTTQGYSHTAFDPFAVPDILLTGTSNDFGVDTDGNGLFDELHVEVEVALTTTDFYQWSARLVDVNGTEIDFDARSGLISAGTAIIPFLFDGEKIGENGVNGPYFVKGLLMFGQTGPNTVRTDVAETQPYSFFEFEGFELPPLPHDFILLADKDVKIDGQIDSEGAVHANKKVHFKKGNPSIHTGDVTAVDEVKIDEGQTLEGDVTAPTVVLDPGAVVTGTVTEALVAIVPLPVLAFTAGGDNVKVKKDETLALPPGTYRDVKVEDRGTLILSSGVYFFKKLELKKEATLLADPAAGLIEVNVVDDMKFGKDSKVDITLVFPGASRLLTLNGLKNVDVEDRAVVLGTLTAPEGQVKLEKDVFFKGIICAEKIDVKKGVTFVPHGSAATPAPMNLDKSAENSARTAAQGGEGEPQFVLAQNYPNPFNPTTTIAFALPEARHVELVIFDVMGRRVATLVDGVREAGQHRVPWEASNLPSGVYFYRISAGDFAQVKQMLLIK